jgi:predicted dehydrogenase
MTRTAIVVGAGLAVPPHLYALNELGVVVTGVVSKDLQRIARVKGIFPQANSFSTLEEALGSPADMAVVCTPPNTHAAVIELLAKADLDVVVEKPLGVDSASAQACTRAMQNAGRRLAVVFQHRYKPAAAAARRVMAEGSLGSIVAASVSIPWWRAQSYYDEPGRGSLARDGGGVLITQAIHTLDLYRWLAGPVDAVTAVQHTSAVHRMQGEDVVHAILEHTSSATSSYCTSFFASTAVRFGGAESVEFFGTDAVLKLVGSNLYLIRNIEECLVSDDRPADGADPSVMAPWFVDMYRDILDAWANGRDADCDGGSALQTQSLISALYTAAATRSRVQLSVAPSDPLENGDRNG